MGSMWTDTLAALRAHSAYNWQAFGDEDGTLTPLAADVCNATMTVLCNAKWAAAPVLMGTGWVPADLKQQLAAFLILRGDHWWFGSGWSGCSDAAPAYSPLLNMDVGVPTSTCSVSRGSVWTRTWSRGSATLDCATWTADLAFA